ncbi:MAG TPA: phosphoribosylamine--glycine ligase [Candidatus Thermoplasmatota archaeon]|nr:phosphoribosylamine--glycine ligase [Candidatus Thermoplasmatota archaeon]
MSPATPPADPSANDGTELYVKPKAKPAPPAEPAKTVGGAEEMPGSPRPAKPGRSSIPDAPDPDADHRRQTPGHVEEDAEVWDGKKWVLPSGKPVDPSGPGKAGPATGKDGKPVDPAGPTVEADEDTEVISTPRRNVEHEPSAPIFGTSRDIIRKSGTGGGKTGKEGQDFQEYQRPLVPDASTRTFGLGGYVGASGASPRDTSDTMDLKARPASQPGAAPPTSAYVPASATTPTSALPSRPGGATEVWPPPHGSSPTATPLPGGTLASARAPPGQVHSKPLPPGTLNVLLVGSGAREHAMALAIRRSQRAQLFVVTKHRNPGLVKSATGFKILDDRDAAGIVAFAKMQKIHVAVVGPESPLESGVSDALRAIGVAVASPSAAAARIETSKTFMRELMERHQVPGRLGFHAFTDEAAALAFLERKGPQWAIKPVGLTGGKGVQIHGDHFHDLEGAKAYVRSIFAGKVGGGSVQFEELARGEEYTLMAFTDGATVLPMPAVQDHKRLFEGDKGPNTGGMGSYSQADGLLPFLNEADYAGSASILQGLVDALRADGTPYVGTIYGQFMLTAAGPKVIEVNARFGDPEAMNVLHLLESDYLALLEGMATGTLAGKQARFRQAATVVKYVVPVGYGEGRAESGRQIEVDDFNVKRVKGFVYFANVEQQPTGPLTTMASRAVGVLGEGPTVEHANAVCEAALKHVHGDRLFVRHDIGTPQLLQKRVENMMHLRGQVA